MRYLVVLWILLVCLLAISAPVDSAVRYVNPTSPGPTFDGLSWITAFHTIGGALAVSTSGDEVWVAGGTYTGDLTVGAGVSLLGGFTGNEVSRDERNWKVTICLIDGAVSCGSNSSVDGFHSTRGIGANTVSNVLIANNTVYTAMYGITYDHASGTIVNNRVTGNYTGIYVTHSATTISGNEAFGNSVSGIDARYGPTVITNNTAVGNGKNGIHTEGGGTGISYVATNNITAFNTVGMAFGATTATITYNDSYGNITNYSVAGNLNPTNVSVNPKFACWQSGDIHIQPDSPCRNAGTGTAAGLQTTDIDNQPRIQGTKVDIGSDESDGVTRPCASRVVYVNASAAANGDGASWATAYTTIKAAMTDLARTGPAEVWVARGSYGNFGTRQYARVYGGFAGTETARDQRNPRQNRTVIQNPGGTGISCAPESTIDGFTVQRCDIGITCSAGAPMITNNVVIGCTSKGITVIECKPTIAGNVVAANKVGIYSGSGTGWIVSNTVVGNGECGIETNQGSDKISNNIVAFSNYGISGGVTGIQQLSYNNVYGNFVSNYSTTPPGATDISVDPKLASYDTGDVHLLADSPCRNAGSNSASSMVSTDMDGEARVVDGVIDIGADELSGSVPPSPAGVVYVNAAAAPGGDGTSWAGALTSIQAGLDAAALLGATQVWVAQGQYSEDVFLVPYVRLLGGFAGDETTLESRVVSEHPTRLVAHANSYAMVEGANEATIDGFAIRGGDLGVRCQTTSTTIRNCHIYGQRFNALYCINSARPRIINNRMSGCSVAVYIDDAIDAIVAGNVIIGNITGIGIDSSYAPGAHAKVINNTLAFNSDAGISGGNGDYRNNIAAFNGTGIKCTMGTMTLANNNVYGNDYNYTSVAAGATDFSADPMFASYPTGDVHISPTSPCRNAGDSLAPHIPAIDMDGEPRIQQDAVDVGADETDGVTPIVSPRVVYVSSGAAAGGNGKTWATAYDTIAAGLSDVANGTGAYIWVKKGTYTGTFTLVPFCCLYGGFAGTETDLSQRNWRTNISKIDGNAADKAVIGSNASTIDGFTITNAKYGVYSDSASPTVSNNAVLDCTTAGIYCKNSRSLVVGNRITGGGLNGAVYACYSGTPKIINNYMSGCAYGVKGLNAISPVINNNVMADNWIAGIEANGLISAANNTVVGNPVGINGTGTITNNLIAFNATGLQSATSSVLSRNNVYGNVTNYVTVSPGATDLSVDPKFGDLKYRNLHLQPDSPCRDAGADPGALLTSEDIDGQPRVQGAAIDIGADESDGTAWTPASRVIYVNGSVAVSGDGSSWNAAFKTIRSAVTAAVAAGGAEIWVAKGSYAEGVSVSSKVYMYGGFAGTESALEQRNWRANRTLINSAGVNSPSLLDGFVMTYSAGSGISSTGALPVIRNNVIANSAYDGISLSNNGSPLIQNNVIAYCGRNGFLGYNGTARLINNTIIGCSSAGVSLSGGKLTAGNNIVAFNRAGFQGGSMTLSCNDVYGNISTSGSTANYITATPGAGDISLDPRLSSAETLDAHLRPNSPCRNAGGSSVDLPETDYDGQSRILEGAVDIGADESDGTESSPNVVYVDSRAPAGGNGLSWASACRTIQAALSLPSLASGGEVWVAGGSYTGGITLPPFVALYGGFSGTEANRQDRNWRWNETSIIGQSAVQDVVVSLVRAARIDGFTVSGGRKGILATAGAIIIANNRIRNHSYGIDCALAATSVTNNLVSNCSMYGINGGANGSFVNNTIVRNGTYGLSCIALPLRIANNIVTLNGTGISAPPGTAALLSRNNVFGNTTNYVNTAAGSSAVSADPKLVDPVSGDYHLMPGSPCIDAGAAVEGVPTADLDGAVRPKDGNGDGTAAADIGCYEAPGNYRTIPDAKKVSDGTPVGLYGIVTAGLPDRSYIEATDRLTGIGLLGISLPASHGAAVEGVATTVGGERVLTSPEVLVGHQAAVPAPWGLAFGSLGGGAFGHQPAVQDWRPVFSRGSGYARQLCGGGGANNIGLLVKVSGKVAHPGSGFFYLDGGCLFDDGIASVKGVRVDWPFEDPMPATGADVTILAISSCRTIEGPEGEQTVVRLLRPVSAESVVAW